MLVVLFKAIIYLLLCILGILKGNMSLVSGECIREILPKADGFRV